MMKTSPGLALGISKKTQSGVRSLNKEELVATGTLLNTIPLVRTSARLAALYPASSRLSTIKPTRMILGVRLVLIVKENKSALEPDPGAGFMVPVPNKLPGWVGSSMEA